MEQPSRDLHPAYFHVRFHTEAAQEHWPEQFVIITAYATTGETWSPERNTEADQRLHAELRRRGCTPLRITGYDPHSGHAEPGSSSGSGMNGYESCLCVPSPVSNARK